MGKNEFQRKVSVGFKGQISFAPVDDIGKLMEQPNKGKSVRRLNMIQRGMAKDKNLNWAWAPRSAGIKYGGNYTGLVHSYLGYDFGLPSSKSNILTPYLDPRTPDRSAAKKSFSKTKTGKRYSSGIYPEKNSGPVTFKGNEFFASGHPEFGHDKQEYSAGEGAMLSSTQRGIEQPTITKGARGQIGTHWVPRKYYRSEIHGNKLYRWVRVVMKNNKKRSSPGRYHFINSLKRMLSDSVIAPRVKQFAKVFEAKIRQVDERNRIQSGERQLKSIEEGTLVLLDKIQTGQVPKDIMQGPDAARVLYQSAGDHLAAQQRHLMQMGKPKGETLDIYRGQLKTFDKAVDTMLAGSSIDTVSLTGYDVTEQNLLHKDFFKTLAKTRDSRSDFENEEDFYAFVKKAQLYINRYIRTRQTKGFVPKPNEPKQSVGYLARQIWRRIHLHGLGPYLYEAPVTVGGQHGFGMIEIKGNGNFYTFSPVFIASGMDRRRSIASFLNIQAEMNNKAPLIISEIGKIHYANYGRSDVEGEFIYDNSRMMVTPSMNIEAVMTSIQPGEVVQHIKKQMESVVSDKGVNTAVQDFYKNMIGDAMKFSSDLRKSIAWAGPRTRGSSFDWLYGSKFDGHFGPPQRTLEGAQKKFMWVAPYMAAKSK